MKRKLMTVMLSLVLSAFFAVAAAAPAANSQAAATGPFDASSFRVVQELGAYRLANYDVLNLAIVGYPDEPWMNNITIGPDGFISLPYTGGVKLAGLTLDEATAVLKTRLSEYIIIPELAVVVKQYGPRQVYVMGEVEREGIYTLAADKMNVFAALSSAGGIAPKGRPKHISVVRVAGNEVLVKEVNFDAFVKKQDISQNVRLQDGDMIYVPKSGKILLSQDILPILTTWAIVRDSN